MYRFVDTTLGVDVLLLVESNLQIRNVFIHFFLNNQPDALIIQIFILL